MCFINPLDTNTNLHPTCIKVKFVPRKENSVFPLQRTTGYVVYGNNILFQIKQNIQNRCGLGGLGVACWPLVPKFVGSNSAEAVGFLRAKKNPQHAFLRRGSKAVGPMS